MTMAHTNKKKLTDHMTETHENKFPCKKCGAMYNKKKELDKHIFNEHKSYKPCRNFSTNDCDYGEECRYKHIVLKPGEYVCYKCGDMFGRKSVLLNHIKNLHNDPYLKYLEGKCTYGSRCISVCSECHFSLMNEYPNIFITANYLQMNVRIYSVVYILTNECPNIFIHVVYSRINVQIYPNEKILTEYFGK